MNKYILIGFGTLVSIVVIVVGVYASFYFKEKIDAVKLSNNATQIANERQNTLTSPTILLDNLSCDIATTSKTQNYSVIIRTLPDDMIGWQKIVEDLIHSAKGDIKVNSQTRVYDQYLGYTKGIMLNAVLPINTADSFITSLKKNLSGNDYMDKEDNVILGNEVIGQACNGWLVALQSFSSSEALYLSQLELLQKKGIPDKADLTQKIINIRKQAINTRKSLTDYLQGRVNKAQVYISIRRIPG